MTEAPAPLTHTLRRNCLSALENLGQTLGTMSPSATLGVIIPLLIIKTGSGTWLLFVVTLAVFLLVMLTVTRFAHERASAGSLAVWGKMGLGRKWGAACGWIYCVGLFYCIPGATLCAAAFLDLVLTPWLGPAAGPLRVAMFTIVVGSAAWWAAHRDIKLSTDMTLIIECASVSVMIFLMFAALFHTGAWLDRDQFVPSHVPASAYQASLVLAFLTLGGFETVATLGEEARHPTKTIPRVMFFCLVPLGLLYLFMTYGQVLLMHRGVISISGNGVAVPFSDMARAIHLPFLGPLSSLAVACSYFACTLGSLNAGSRVLYAMSREGLFWRSFGDAHPRNATPHRAIALLSILGLIIPCALLALGVLLDPAIDYLSQLGSFGFLGAYLLVCVALPLYLNRTGRLRWTNTLIGVGSTVMLLAMLFFSIWPLPPAPYCYLVYIFAATVIVGVTVSLFRMRQADFGIHSAGNHHGSE